MPEKSNPQPPILPLHAFGSSQGSYRHSPPPPAPMASNKYCTVSTRGPCRPSLAEPPASSHCHLPLCTKRCVLASLLLRAPGLGTVVFVLMSFGLFGIGFFFFFLSFFFFFFGVFHNCISLFLMRSKTSIKSFLDSRKDCTALNICI